MKTTMNLFLTIGLIACTLTFSSCNNDDNYEIVKRPTALVTVYPNGSEGFIMQLDDSTSLVPTNIKESPFGEKNVRALVNYTVESPATKSPHNVFVNWIDSIRTKQPVATLGKDDNKVFGNDPIEIVRDWVTVAEDGFLTLRIRTLWGGHIKHTINLVSGVNADNSYEFDLKHNANGDCKGYLADALIAFDLNPLWKNHTKEVKIKINWTSFTSKKTAEFKLKMHPAISTTSDNQIRSLSRLIS